KENKKSKTYSKFDQIDGSHPFKKAVPNGFVDYPARKRKNGKVRYFNYELARSMGLVPKDHADKMTKELEKKILDTFALVIINEFDQMNGRSFPKEQMKKGSYMATRYLQMQHDDKTGKTSGDGRSIWNGQIKHKGKTWDISSCGTGATRLSPATSKFNKFFETGDPSISYGCGYAELDEGLATALFSDIFKKNNVETEETLCVLEFEKGFSINVRAHSSLLRPSHFFRCLKQNDHASLKRVSDYYIDSQRNNPAFANCPKEKGKYEFLVKKVCETFARTAADFEDDYIFCWLDWDGDNILMDGGIIDYGSVRQFGLFHHEYRYDDVERYSTSILEQKEKAKRIVQTFVQMADYLKTKDKKSLSAFKNHKLLDEFEKEFENQKNQNILRRMGFNQKWLAAIINHKKEKVEEFRKVFTYFERAKSNRGIVEVNDGITWDAIFCMRDLLRELPQIYLSRDEKVSESEFIEIVGSNYADEEDLKINNYRKKKIKEFQEAYWDLVLTAADLSNQSKQQVLLELSMRSSVINKMERVTGDAISLIVDVVMKKRNSLSSDEVYKLFKKLALFQVFDPRAKAPSNKKFWQSDLMRQFYEIVKERREGI
ncbi:MAG: hypothetical protein WD025_06430, partial [Bacteriovoracaceae bacterium]